MADYKVKAVLSAVSSGFTSTMQNAIGMLDTMSSKVSSGLGLGVLMGIGQQVFSTLSGEVSSLVGEFSSASAAWQTFAANMEISGFDGNINDVKEELQDFAKKTIYSASDMASTFAQLNAVGTKNTTQLVKGFGGLAAASENPTQAMKTLSQQATQMAAKPMVAWMDFKLMLEQTPAGIAAVAKGMGKTTSELISDVQDGKVATEDFFNTIATVGGDANGEFYKMATTYKTVDQAADGLKETITTSLQPAFDVLQEIGINALSKISEAFENVDTDALVGKIQGLVSLVQPYIDAIKAAWDKVKGPVGEAASAIGDAIAKIVGGEDAINGFKGVLDTLANVIVKVANFLRDHADIVAKILTELPKILIVTKLLTTAFKGVSGVVGFFKGLKGAGSVASSAASGTSQLSSAGKNMLAAAGGFLMAAAGVWLLSQAAVQIAEAGPGAGIALAAMVIAIAAFMVIAANLGSQLQAAVGGLLAFGGAILMAGAGMFLMAYGATMVANAGPLAYAALLTMIIGLGIIIALFAVFGPVLTASAPGILAVGAALLMAGAGAALFGVGVLLVCAGLAILSMFLPQIAAYGGQAAVAILQLGAAMLVLGAGALLVGVGAIVAGAGLIVLGAGAIVASVGILLLSAGVVALGASMLLLAASTGLVAGNVSTIANKAGEAAQYLILMVAAVNIVDQGLNALGNVVTDVFNAMVNAFRGATPSVTGEAQSMCNQLQEIFKQIVSPAGKAGKSAVNKMAQNIRSQAASAKASAMYVGQMIGLGLAEGMARMYETVAQIASELVKKADEAIRAKAQIGSPSKVQEKNGMWFAQGFINGIKDSVSEARSVSAQLVSVAMGPSGSGVSPLNGSYEYGMIPGEINVPLYINGKEFARATATDMSSEQSRIHRMENRKAGKI